MLFKKYKSKICAVLIFVLFVNTFCIFADEKNEELIAYEKVIYDWVVASESEIASMSQVEIDLDMIDKINKLYDEEKYNFPTLFSQPTFHPDINEIFGYQGVDAFPITFVSVDEDDNERRNKVALTFDSAYINDYTYKILDILDEYNIKATFFMTLEFMKNNPTHVLEIIKRGHEIGNHSTTHPNFTKVSDIRIINEVLECHNFVKNLCGVEMSLFRFPYGANNGRSITLLKEMGYYPIQWSLDSIDWREEGLETIINRLITSDKLYSGAILLFHNGAKDTTDVLPYFLEFLKLKNMTPVRVSDIIYKKDFSVVYGRQVKNSTFLKENRK